MQELFTTPTRAVEVSFDKLIGGNLIRTRS